MPENSGDATEGMHIPGRDHEIAGVAEAVQICYGVQVEAELWWQL